jgi:hypothetical protein
VSLEALSPEGCHGGNPGFPGCVLNGGGPGGADLIPGSVTASATPPTVTPEPSSIALLGVALAGLSMVKRRKRKSA